MSDQSTSFKEASKQKRRGIVSEMISFLKHNKMWWLLPILIVLLLVGTLVVISGSGALPFIYPF